ncbi:MAG: hypothetical protein AAB573_04125 [Patescibacteria group bacterium]
MSFDNDHEVVAISPHDVDRVHEARDLYSRIKTNKNIERKRKAVRMKGALLNVLQIPQASRHDITGVLSIGDDRYLIYRE